MVVLQARAKGGQVKRGRKGRSLDEGEFGVGVASVQSNDAVVRDFQMEGSCIIGSAQALFDKDAFPRIRDQGARGQQMNEAEAIHHFDAPAD